MVAFCKEVKLCATDCPFGIDAKVGSRCQELSLRLAPEVLPCLHPQVSFTY